MSTQRASDSNVISTIPLPSADLIAYRFDQADKRFEEINKKLDAILAQTAHFVTEDHVRTMILESDTPLVKRVEALEDRTVTLKETDDKQQGSIDTTRKIVTAGLSVLGIVATLLSVYITVVKN